MQQFNPVVLIMEENMFLRTDLKNFYFYLIRAKNTDENLNHEIEFIIKCNES